MAFNDLPIETLKRRIDEAQRFLSISLSISNAHTVDFYTRDVWSTFMCVSPEEVLCAISSTHDHTGAVEEKKNTTFGFCNSSKKLVDISALLRAAKAHFLPDLGVCMQLEELMQNLRLIYGDTTAGESSDKVLVPDEFMNCKKAHEVQAMSEVVASLAECCRVKQVIDVGSGKGYLCSYLSLRFNLQVFGIDSSSTNTHGAQERNRKLKKFSKAYRKQNRAAGNQALDSEDGSKQHSRNCENSDGSKNFLTKETGSFVAQVETSDLSKQVTSDLSTSDNATLDPSVSDAGCSFLGMMSLDVIEDASSRVHPSQLSLEEREKRKRENLERKAREGRGNDSDSSLFSPLTSYVTAETELKTLITELEDAVLVGLHTCGDLAPSTLRMFRAKQELRAVCSVGCCYHLLSEEFDQDRQGCISGVCGFPMSQYLKDQACFCGRNARMSACLALERVSAGGGLSDTDIQSYYDRYRPRMNEMVAFNMGATFLYYVDIQTLAGLCENGMKGEMMGKVSGEPLKFPVSGGSREEPHNTPYQASVV
ncbi:Methyltransferase-like protein 25 [Anabarilius grahami]|uniref:Methyltransferase-like protein 25 n=1 Tax=Anabarilius grahami TaxID=495550 RepID=A0A3N0XDD1_ANAGA|nr:Methyltransferase-like protein 25 [Anabarilius grahami]